MGSSAPTPEREHSLDAFARAISRLREQTSQDGIFAQVPAILCEVFSAVRSEVWLWDEPSRSAYLIHAAGAMAKHWRDYITHDSGTLGQAAASYQSVHNLSVAEAGKDSFDFVQRAQLSHASVLPLKANGQVIAICVCYSGGPAGPDILACWQAFAELVSIALQEIKSQAEFR